MPIPRVATSTPPDIAPSEMVHGQDYEIDPESPDGITYLRPAQTTDAEFLAELNAKLTALGIPQE